MFAFLRMVRFSLAPSVIADVAAGAALAGGFEVLPVLAAACASLLLFCGGMALNARVDIEADSRTRPERPLPSGEISPRTATLTAVFGLAAPGLVLAALGTGTGLRHALAMATWAGAMAGMVALYHTPWRRRPVLGPMLLGAIRSSNLLFGAVAVGGLQAAGGATLLPAATYGVYVAGASLVAHQEDRAANLRLVRAGASIALAAAATVIALVAIRESVGGWRVQYLGFAVIVYSVGGSWKLWQAHRGDVGILARVLLSQMVLVPVFITTVAGGIATWALAVAACFAVRLLVRRIPPT